jgi:hypothetical protein
MRDSLGCTMALTPLPDRFAAAVAARLDDVVPPGFAVRSHGPGIDVYLEGYTGPPTMTASAQNLARLQKPLEKEIESIAWAMLNGVQDGVMETTAEQWPIDGAGRAAEPGARVEGEVLRMWFGDERAPILMLAPLNLRELLEGAA